MSKYIYGLIGLGVAAVIGTYAVSASTTNPADTSRSDITAVNSDMANDLIEWRVQMTGWTMMAKQGQLSDPNYRAVLSSDISSISSKVSLYETLLADSK